MKSSYLLVFALISFVSLTFFYTFSESNEDDTVYIKSIEQWRKENTDYLYKLSSPLIISQEDSIEVNYYSTNKKYRVNAELIKNEKYETTDITETNEKKVAYIIYGVLNFDIDDKQQTLTLFRDLKHSDSYLLPFKDKTNGIETYGAGRMLPVKIRPKQTIVELDFNRAFNPYCAYNMNYICPKTPNENRLEVSIKAGEKTPKH